MPSGVSQGSARAAAVATASPATSTLEKSGMRVMTFDPLRAAHDFLCELSHKYIANLAGTIPPQLRPARLFLASAVPFSHGTEEVRSPAANAPSGHPLAPDPARSTQEERRHQLGAAGALHRWRGTHRRMGGEPHGHGLRL